MARIRFFLKRKKQRRKKQKNSHNDTAMEEFKNEAEQLFCHYKESKLPVPNLRQHFLDSGYMDTVYDDFRSELVLIKSRIVSSADEAQECNVIIDRLVQQLKDIVENSL